MLVATEIRLRDGELATYTRPTFTDPEARPKKYLRSSTRLEADCDLFGKSSDSVHVDVENTITPTVYGQRTARFTWNRRRCRYLDITMESIAPSTITYGSRRGIISSTSGRHATRHGCGVRVDGTEVVDVSAGQSRSNVIEPTSRLIRPPVSRRRATRNNRRCRRRHPIRHHDHANRTIERHFLVSACAPVNADGSPRIVLRSSICRCRQARGSPTDILNSWAINPRLHVAIACYGAWILTCWPPDGRANDSRSNDRDGNDRPITVTRTRTLGIDPAVKLDEPRRRINDQTTFTGR